MTKFFEPSGHPTLKVPLKHLNYYNLECQVNSSRILGKQGLLSNFFILSNMRKKNSYFYDHNTEAFLL